MRQSLIGFFRKNGIFLMLFALICVFYYDSVLHKGPLNTHIWRQADCISLTKNYSTGTPFLEPEMHIQLADDLSSGKSAGEFPILYYGVGKLWQWFGESYFTYRLVWLIILFFGTFAFFSSCRRIFNNQFWSIFLTGLLLCSPTFVVYGVSFLTDVPAFCFILIGLYFIVRYHQENKIGSFWLAMLFFSLAGLIKVSSMIAFIFLGFILLIETFGVKTLNGKTVFKKDSKEWMGFIAVPLTIFLWYYYAASYNDTHQFKYTFNDIYPIWKPEEGGLVKLWERVRTYSSYIFLNRTLWWMLGICFLLIVFLKRKITLLARLASIMITLGAIAYISLWGPLLGVHDYYYSALLILIPGIFIPTVHLFKVQFPKAYQSYWVQSFFGLLLVFNFMYCIGLTRIKFSKKKTTFNIIGNSELISELNYVNWEVEYKLYRFQRMQEYLKEIGIKETDKLIILPDVSFNATLILSNHKGWTNFKKYDKPQQIRELIQKNAKYLLLGNPELKKAPHLIPFVTDSVGVFEDVGIYRLNKNQ